MIIWRSLCLVQFFILLTIFLFLGLTPAPDMYVPIFNDKLMHFSGYFVAAFSISFAYPRYAFWQRAIFLILFSIGIEIGQHFMPPRTFDVFDICANSGGVLTGLTLITILEKELLWFKKFLHLSQQ